MAVSFKGAHFPQEIILTGIRWYVAYPLSTRPVEELMRERGVHVDHATINRWVIRYRPPLEQAFHRRKRPVWLSWRLDETYRYCWRMRPPHPASAANCDTRVWARGRCMSQAAKRSKLRAVALATCCK
jgi:hypothetical protein